MRKIALPLTCLTLVVLLPMTVFAQAAITGIVKDASGAVLPGVTVEAASTALLEKTRSVTTDGAGLYRIETLPPGNYDVTYTLAGFNTTKRQGVQLTGAFTATINMEMRIGSLTETITVTGAAPVVDVSSAMQERVVNKELIDTIPAGRTAFNYAVLVPGITINGSQDVGGSGNNATPNIQIHGGRSTDQLILQNGIFVGAGSESGWGSPISMNPVATQEIALDTAAFSADLPTGGVRINQIARDGGNTFHGSIFGGFADDKMQGNNFSAALQAAGLKTPDSLRTNWEINPGFGGPIQKDRIWFFAATRYFHQSQYAGGAFVNLNANKPALWTYAPDVNQPAANDGVVRDGQLRMSWQVTAKNKVGLNWHEQVNTYCLNAVSATVSPEAAECRSYPLQRQALFDYTAPVTNRLLLEAGGVGYFGISDIFPSPGLDPAMITVTEQSTGLRYRGDDPNYRSRPNRTYNVRGAVSYITGTHSFKVGFNHTAGWAGNHLFVNQPLTYRFNNGVPNQLTELAYPYDFNTNLDHSLGVYAQDRWTVRRLTASYALRFDYFASSIPEETIGPSPLTPTRNLAFPAQSDLSLKDLTPKLGIVYDVLGNGKTALKASLNKYLQSLATNGLAAAPNPVNQLVVNTTRSWTDSNKNFAADCNLTNPAAQNLTTSGGDICGAMANPLFGTSQAGTTFDPAILTGWNKRGFNWEFSTGVQQQLLPRLSVEVTYFRRWYGNMLVTDSRAYAATDYTTYSLTAPVDPRLPGGGGNVITGLYDLNPNKFGVAPDNFVTFSDNYGSVYEHWNGLDFTTNYRPGRGVVLQGGFSSGKRTMDSCAIATVLPESTVGVSNPSLIGALGSVGYGINPGVADGAGTLTPTQFCHQDTGFTVQGKFLGSYTVPKIDLLVSATFQSLPGPAIAAFYTATNAVAAASLGRSLSGGATTVTTDIVSPGSLYGQRLNQLDVRLGKILRMNGTKSVVNLDVFNLMNAAPVTSLSNAYATWQTPNSTLSARFAKVSFQFDF